MCPASSRLDYRSFTRKRKRLWNFLDKSRKADAKSLKKQKFLQFKLILINQKISALPHASLMSNSFDLLHLLNPMLSASHILQFFYFFYFLHQSNSFITKLSIKHIKHLTDLKLTKHRIIYVI